MQVARRTAGILKSVGLHHWLEEMHHPPSTAGTSRIHPGRSRAEHQLETEESPPASNEALTQQLPRFRSGCRRHPSFFSPVFVFDLTCVSRCTNKNKMHLQEQQKKTVPTAGSGRGPSYHGSRKPPLPTRKTQNNGFTYKQNKTAPRQEVDVDHCTMAHASHACRPEICN